MKAGIGLGIMVAPESDVPQRQGKYVSIRYSERLAESSIEPSVGGTGDSHDNALAEAINGLYKAEVIHRCGPWKTREAVELATLKWVSWFNNKRLLEPIGYIQPAVAEGDYWRQNAPVTSTTKPARAAAHQEGGTMGTWPNWGASGGPCGELEERESRATKQST